VRHVTCDRCGKEVDPGFDSQCWVILGSTKIDVDLCNFCQKIIRVEIVRYIEGDPVNQGPWVGEARWR
jgi:NAD-dependent SIR2 family protein deacetylase